MNLGEEKERVDVEFLYSILDYNHITGDLFWKKRSPEMFKDGVYTAERICRAWNRKNYGSKAFTAISNGYSVGRINDIMYSAHSVAWALYYGEWPDKHIDHINLCKHDNSIKNLRLVSVSQNQMNTLRRSTNNVGVKGVGLHKKTGKYRARIQCRKKSYHLGLFDNLEDAAKAYGDASKKFHNEFGRIDNDMEANK